MFPATITLHNAAQLNAVMRALGETPVANFDVQAAIDKAESSVKTTKVEDIKADKPAAQAKGDSTEKNSDAKTAPTEPSASADKADAPETSKALTYLADIKPRVLGLVKAGKRNEAVKLLESFGVDHGEKLTADQYADFVVKADALLGA